MIKATVEMTQKKNTLQDRKLDKSRRRNKL